MPLDTPNREWDTLVMGRRGTYEPGLEIGITSPCNHLKQYVFSTTLEPVDNPQVEIVDTDPVELVRRLKKEEGLNIWLCGGGNLAGQLIDEIDQLIIKSSPVIASEGVQAFTGNFQPTQLTVTTRQEFSSGARVTWFDRT
ncbi:dihydrofolate reductase family protein [Nocardia sp. NBC_00403]|uniref:dihydrofolate reductase family protein n=1 Tax=Nocardia sp. NBC_00403 TaxID=2975990 RepID=UPI002E21CA22